MKFDINDYKGKYVMHCKTEDEAKEFCEYLHSVGRKWQNGTSYTDLTNWDEETETICYNFNHGLQASKGFYRRHNYTILEWSDFKANEFTKADLKDGMIVEYANGWRRMVLNGNLLSMSGHALLRDFTDDLKSHFSQGLNIHKVYTCNTGCVSDLTEIFETCNLTLIWERKEKPKPVEMTIEEICKALGKEIKIVKG